MEKRDVQTKAFWEFEIRGTSTSVNTRQSLSGWVVAVLNPEGSRIVESPGCSWGSGYQSIKINII